MTDQELRRLSRADLIDIIYTLQQQKEQAEQQLAQAQAQLQEKTMQTTERQYQLGMIGKLDYLNRKYAYDSAVIQAQIAKYNLLQAIQSYEWVLNGLANAS